MEIGDLYPYWARERDTLITGLREIADKERAAKSHEEFDRIWDCRVPDVQRLHATPARRARRARRHDGTKIAYRHIKPADLKKEIPAFRRTLPIERLLWSIVQEEAHHRGQVYLLLRLQGIAPPERKD
jgi:hypothetical protein